MGKNKGKDEPTPEGLDVTNPYRSVYDVQCGYCWALPGYMCRTKQGAKGWEPLFHRNHKSRDSSLDAARQAWEAGRVQGQADVKVELRKMLGLFDDVVMPGTLFDSLYAKVNPGKRGAS